MILIMLLYILCMLVFNSMIIHGLFVNTSKCELYSTGDLSIFLSEMKSSTVLNFEILGAPIGRNVQRPRGFCTCWRMLVLWILRWHCFSFVSVAVSVRWYILLVLHLPLLWLMHCNCLIMTFIMLLLQWMPLATGPTLS